LPTDQFMRDGIDRWLARRMAAGRLPDEQRFNRYHGVHDADWHVRMGRAREELIEELDRMADDPDIAEMLDIPALQKRLREFPAESTLDADLWHAYIVTIPLAISAGRFVAYAKGRNDI
jgi:asparagine synthase (glutamine-hydrolysing)